MELTIHPTKAYFVSCIARIFSLLTGFDEKILALYAKGMTTRDIGRLSISMASWCMCVAPQQPFSAQTMYVALGVNMQGRKELLGLWLSETEKGPSFGYRA